MSTESVLSSPLHDRDDISTVDLEGGKVPQEQLVAAKTKRKKRLRKKEVEEEEARRPLLATKVEKARWTCSDVWKKCLCLLVISPIIISIIILATDGVRNELSWLPKYKDGQVFDETGRRIYRVAFFGDSLIRFSDQTYGLVAHVMTALQRTYPQIALDAISTGEGGNQVADLLARFNRDVLVHKPDCIIIYFDSDATDRVDADEPGTKNAYFDHISQLLRMCTQQSPGCVALAGPTLFGELPRGSNLKDAVLDDYVNMNAQAAAALNVTYFRTRDLFFHNLPSSWMLPTGYLTLDGEHHNAEGVGLIQRVFETWLEAKFAPIAAMYQKAKNR